MELDLAVLSRLQFALTIMFHYLFPPLTIGLGMLMVAAEGMWLKTRDPLYESIAFFWTRLFAVNFAMGVATGIVMEFEFGTNWATYSRFVGDVFGRLWPLRESSPSSWSPAFWAWWYSVGTKCRPSFTFSPPVWFAWVAFLALSG